MHQEAINTFVIPLVLRIITTAICILIGYPAAWILSKQVKLIAHTGGTFILPMG